MQKNNQEGDTSQAILILSQKLFQERGYNAFSVRDLSREIGIKPASIYYHFPSKADLAYALVIRQRGKFKLAFAEIDSQTDDSNKKLKLYLKLFYEDYRKTKSICFCSMLAADFASLPLQVQQEVKRLFADHEQWLAKMLEEGKRTKVLNFKGTPEIRAKNIFAAIEGSTISACTFGDEQRLTSAAEWIESMFK
ncbi:MAG: TetR/AcrR family transcriptional regulator [Candidatus Dadabacteria bacterium]|jgi:TetR/AcrR family transcriptional repressor of nem operon|nr:TetR/AcrR family transcriptional regulator [Candidatus Dadabacteria bacterium]